jgi:hypothetical protein
LSPIPDSLVLGSFADLEWLGDLAWNMGCIMVSEQNFELNVFEEIPITVSAGIPENTERGSMHNERVSNQAGLLSFMQQSHRKTRMTIIVM